MWQANIIRGSDEDFLKIFETDHADAIVQKAALSPGQILIITRGSGDLDCVHQGDLFNFPVSALPAVKSTVGAGDAFNSGFLFALSHLKLNRQSLLQGLSAKQLGMLVGAGLSFARDVCQSSGNQISDAVAERAKSLVSFPAA